MSELGDMIKQSNNATEREILLRLMALNKEAYLHMSKARGRKEYPIYYRSLQKTKTWKEAKELIVKYYKLKSSILICRVCGKEINGTCTLHHTVYSRSNIFNPIYTNLIHTRCHDKELRDF